MGAALHWVSLGEVTYRTDADQGYLWFIAHHRGERFDLLHPNDVPELRPRRGEALADYLDRLDAYLVASGWILPELGARPPAPRASPHG